MQENTSPAPAILAQVELQRGDGCGGFQAEPALGGFDVLLQGKRWQSFRQFAQSLAH